MFETSLNYASVGVFENTQLFKSSNQSQENEALELKRSRHLSPRRTTKQEVTCIGCNDQHQKSARIKKMYGALITNHCPKCSCESFWLI